MRRRQLTMFGTGKTIVEVLFQGGGARNAFVQAIVRYVLLFLITVLLAYSIIPGSSPRVHASASFTR
jgi:hypothetical protein